MPGLLGGAGEGVLRAVNTQFRFGFGVLDTATDAEEALTGRQTVDVDEFITNPERFGPTEGNDLTAGNVGAVTGGFFGLILLLVGVYTLGQLFNINIFVGDDGGSTA